MAAAALMLFASGTALGVVVAMPLFGSVIPDGVTSTLGAALGAMIAVVGAAWVAGAGVRRRALALNQATAAALKLQFDLWVTLEGEINRWRVGTPKVIDIREIAAFRQGVDLTVKRLSGMQPAFVHDAFHVAQHAALTEWMNNIDSATSNIVAITDPQETRPQDVTEKALTHWFGVLGDSVAGLRAAADDVGSDRC